MAEWRDSGYQIPLPGSKRPPSPKYEASDWLYGVRNVLGGREGELQAEADQLQKQVAEAEFRQAQISERLVGAESRENELRSELLREQEKAKTAQEAYEAMT